MSEHEHQYETHPYKIAFIIDGEVVDTLRSHERLGAILLSEPIIVDVTDRPEVFVGDKYDEESGEFSHE